MVPHAVIFDCDGVLIDSEVISIETEITALASIGIQLTFSEVVERYVGMSDLQMKQAVADEFGVTVDDGFWARLQARTQEALAAGVRPIDGMPALVREVTVPYGVASSSSHQRLDVSLAAAGMSTLFGVEIRFSSDDVPRGKPAPDIFLHAAGGLGVDPIGCVVVEDSPSGIIAALAAGMRPIGFSGGGHADDRWAERLGQAGAWMIASDAAELRHLLGL